MKRVTEKEFLYLTIMPVFEEAMYLYETQKIAEAKKKFKDCLLICKDDLVSEIYMERCIELLKKGGV